MQSLFEGFVAEKKKLADLSMTSVIGEVDCSVRLESEATKKLFSTVDYEVTSAHYPFARHDRIRREVFMVCFGWMMETREEQSHALVAERLDVLGLRFGRVEDLLIIRSNHIPKADERKYIFAPGTEYEHADKSRWITALSYENGRVGLGVGSLMGTWTRGITFAAVRKDA